MAKRAIDLDFERLLDTLSKQIYDTPMAFLRENVQNAVDALRMKNVVGVQQGEGRVDIRAQESIIRIQDSGIGMSADDLHRFFWKMGASGKNTELARKAGCIGTFGIGGFANFGVCDSLVVTSTKDSHPGVRSELRKEDFGGGTPEVTYSDSNEADPHGTIVTATLENAIDPNRLEEYLRGFVRFVEEEVYFNEKLLSGTPFVPSDAASGLNPLADTIDEIEFGEGFKLDARFYSDGANMLTAIISHGEQNGVPFHFEGIFRLVNGALEVFKNGFKLCNVSVPTAIGFTGRLNCSLVHPTAGRDSLTAESQHFLNAVCSAVERRAIEWVLSSSELVAQHTRVLRFVLSQGLVEQLEHMLVTLGDNSTVPLGTLRRDAESGTKIYFGRKAQEDLLEVLHASGNRVVLLSSDGHRLKAERSYLEKYCEARPYEGLVQVKERYDQLTSFEIAFLSEMEYAIASRYEVRNVHLEPAAITGGVPVFASDPKAARLRIIVDVRHPDIAKLKQLEGSSLLYSMTAEFCKEYLSGTLKSRSPKFFGSGALNFDELVRRRAEIWDLGSDEIHTEFMGEELRRGGYGGAGVRETVGANDVGEVSIGEEGEEELGKKILRIVDRSGQLGVEGYYLRLMDRPAKAFGDDIQAMEQSSLFWFGNRITFAFSDGIETTFHYEVKLQELVQLGEHVEGGMIELGRTAQQIRGGLFLPIPDALERYLVPRGDLEITIRVNYEWFDLKGGRVWPVATER